mmetsp:Transcript_5528/g.21635  ORF Transcript_5528/g.21635 Transcript_5528/m.21635 type:complete len:204 (+) Transcript_5528:448-1059(+)
MRVGTRWCSREGKRGTRARTRGRETRRALRTLCSCRTGMKRRRRCENSWRCRVRTGIRSRITYSGECSRWKRRRRGWRRGNARWARRGDAWIERWTNRGTRTTRATAIEVSRGTNRAMKRTLLRQRKGRKRRFKASVSIATTKTTPGRNRASRRAKVRTKEARIGSTTRSGTTTRMTSRFQRTKRHRKTRRRRTQTAMRRTRD